MYRGKSTAGKMSDFDREAYEDTLTTECEIRIDEIEFNSSTKIDGKVAAGLSVFLNGSKVYHLAHLGYFKSKSGHYVWNQESAAGLLEYESSILS